MFAAPLAASAVLDVGALPWAIAAVALTWRSPAEIASPRLDSEPQRQLMRSRRRNEHASVVVMRAWGPEPHAEKTLWSALRATDGSEVVLQGDVVELRAVLEDQEVDRRAFERRLRAAVSAWDMRFGWAAFPADGVTLEVLIDAAREDLARGARAAGEPVEREAGQAMPVAVTATVEGR